MRSFIYIFFFTVLQINKMGVLNLIITYKFYLLNIWSIISLSILSKYESLKPKNRQIITINSALCGIAISGICLSFIWKSNYNVKDLYESLLFSDGVMSFVVCIFIIYQYIKGQEGSTTSWILSFNSIVFTRCILTPIYIYTYSTLYNTTSIITANVISFMLYILQHIVICKMSTKKRNILFMICIWIQTAKSIQMSNICSLSDYEIYSSNKDISSLRSNIFGVYGALYIGDIILVLYLLSVIIFAKQYFENKKLKTIRS